MKYYISIEKSKGHKIKLTHSPDHLNTNLTWGNLLSICTVKFDFADINFLFIHTFPAAMSCESSWALAPPRLMVTGHPSLALTPLGTGRTVGPQQAGWESHAGTHRHFTFMFKAHLLPVSLLFNFLGPIHTHVCHTWLLSSLAHTHSGPSHGGNSNYGHSHTSAHSPLQRIP